MIWNKHLKLKSVKGAVLKKKKTYRVTQKYRRIWEINPMITAAQMELASLLNSFCLTQLFQGSKDQV